MPFKSRLQQKACYASNGFNGKVDCKEWSRHTDQKSLPKRAKKVQGGIMQKGGESETIGGIGPVTFLNSYFESDQFKKRYLINNDEKSYRDQLDFFKKQSQNYKPFNVNGQIGDQIGSYVPSFPLPKDEKALWDLRGIPKGTNVVYDEDQAKKYNFNLQGAVVPHEYSHFVRNLSNKDNLNIAKNNNTKTGNWGSVDTPVFRTPYQIYKEMYEGKKEKKYPDFNRYLSSEIGFSHDYRPEENYGDLNSLRYLLYQQGIYDVRKGDLDLPTLNKFLEKEENKKDFNVERLLKMYTPEQIIEMNNKIALSKQKQSPISRMGGSIHYGRKKKKCMNCGGKMQQGGFPRQQDFPDYESWQQAVDEFIASTQQPLPRVANPTQTPITQNDFLPVDAMTSSGATADPRVLEPRVQEDIDAQANAAYETGSAEYQKNFDKDLGMSVLDRGSGFERRNYRNFYRGKYGEGINPVDPFQVALGITGAKAGLSWLSGAIDRRRQRRYMQNQYSTLGQLDPIPVSNFQPTPYNLYAKFGGSLKRYKNFVHPIYTNKAINDNFPMDDGKMKEGGWIQKAAASIKRRGTAGKCTPITKSTCTGRAKALAKTFKKIARNRKKHD